MANKAETLDERAKRAAADAKSGAAEFAETARERVTDMAQDARDRAWQYGQDTKNEAANETSKVAEALRKAASDLHEGSPQEKIFAKLADTVADTADGLRDMDIDEMGYAVNDFARRNSAAFLGGAALLGFVAARFLKASSRDNHGSRGGYQTGAYQPGGRHDLDRPEQQYRPTQGQTNGRTTGQTAGHPTGQSTGQTTGAASTHGDHEGSGIPGAPLSATTGAQDK